MNLVLFRRKPANQPTNQPIDQDEIKPADNPLQNARAVLEFSLDGIILDACNDFLQMLGFTFDEVRGRHHSCLIDSHSRESAEYKNFWSALNRGEHRAGQFRRLSKDGREIWIAASYNPIYHVDGKPYKIVKYAASLNSANTAG